MAQRIVAISRVSFNSSGTLNAEMDYIKSILPKGDSLIVYDEVGDLVTQIGAILTAKKDCLGMLDVDAHGWPLYCNQLVWNNVDSWGQALMQVVWCDNASIYLDSCNSGCSCYGPGWNSQPQTPTGIGPIAEALRDAMTYDPTTFPIHLTVYGSRGYLSGNHIGGTESARASYMSGRLWWKEYHHMYGGSADGTGPAAWKPFNNW